MLLRSEELRWFPEPASRAEWRRWFTDLPYDHPAESLWRPEIRTDYYLRLEDTSAIGIKWREGRLEIKKFVKQGQEEHWSETVTARRTTWEKWTYLLSEDARQEVGVSSAWVPVTKWLRVRMFAVEAPDRVVPIAAKAKVAAGCGLEFTELRAADDDLAMTIGFETFGDTEPPIDVLKLVAADVLSQPNMPRLSADWSYDYPEWLKRRSSP